ncbi:hypothetical protein EVAR_8657_1 [Eumeta japonica]|uniref:Uncharacterized protein n=1 Tax=Eumeta variegata TaxID=151549 RepID=A0A4C1TUF6_EUMVA|nr:hypothetical protein EVAR_8657_1 [Eumeta japonica]
MDTVEVGGMYIVRTMWKSIASDYPSGNGGLRNSDESMPAYDITAEACAIHQRTLVVMRSKRDSGACCANLVTVDPRGLED